MSDVIPCKQNNELKALIDRYSEVLMTEAHKLGDHGLSEEDFYRGGLFQGAIESVRGKRVATMHEKRDFVRLVLNYMQDRGCILDWESSGDSNRHDYTIHMPNDRTSVIELKGCMDGNNTTIFERPSHAQEFIIWSVCTNAGGDPRHNVWSGIHTRLSAEIIDKEKLVDGLIVWDWLCGTIGRPCPKLAQPGRCLTEVGPFRLTTPCIYLFPGTIPSVRNNPSPKPHELHEVHFLKALHECFNGLDEEIHRVRFSVEYKGTELVRTTCVERGGTACKSSRATPIRRK